jgi:hypothetical protein
MLTDLTYATVVGNLGTVQEMREEHVEAQRSFAQAHEVADGR